jgi:hypothetical protein
VEDDLSPFNQRIQGLREELGLTDVFRNADPGLPRGHRKRKEGASRRVRAHEPRHPNRQAKKTLVQTEIADFEARSKRGSRGRTGTEVGAAQPPKFDGSTLWTVYRRQLETVAEHNYWTPCEKYTYPMATLNEPATHILHGVPTGATYEEVTVRQ